MSWTVAGPPNPVSLMSPLSFAAMVMVLVMPTAICSGPVTVPTKPSEAP